MNCPTCHHKIPDEMLVCPDCFAQRAWKELQTRQYDPLRQVKAKQADLTVRTFKGQRHVQMFFCEQAFCNLPITDRYGRSHMDWGTGELASICGGCRDALTRLMEEACRPSS